MSEVADESPRQDRDWFYRRVGLVTIALACFGCCFGMGFFFGLARSTHMQYEERAQRERELVEPILASDPAFVDVTLSPKSSGGISMQGKLPSPQAASKLYELLVRAVGEPLAKELIRGVWHQQLDFPTRQAPTP